MGRVVRRPMITLTEISPTAKARLTGLLYLVLIVAGIFAQGFVAERLVSGRDAGVTANNILGNESLYRLGFTIYLIEMSAQIATAVLFYQLLKPVSRTASQLYVVFELVGCGIKTMSRLFYFAPLLVLGGATYLSVFNKVQLEALAQLSIRINDQGAGIALAFFGFSSVLQGWLVFKSTFLPRWLGVIGMIAGIGWLAWLSPSLGEQTFLYVALVGILGSLAIIFWLIVFGVDELRWRERADASAASIWR